MNHSKLILVGVISAFVAITTALLGVTGTIIGSVLSSVLYNVLSEALEKPVNDVKISHDFEWDIAYLIPLVIIVFIQLFLILAFLSEWGLLPRIFLKIYLSIQGVADNNLYRVLGFSLIIMSIYPFVLKPDFVRKIHCLLISFVGLIFLARGFSDIGNTITSTYGLVFHYFDFPIAIIAFLILVFVIYKIILYAKISKPESDLYDNVMHKNPNTGQNKKYYHNQNMNKSVGNLDDLKLKQNKKINKYKSRKRGRKIHKPKENINQSSNNIHFESNDLLDDYKK